MKAEKRTETRFYNWCKDNGIFVRKLKAVGVRGFPDRTILLPGPVIVFIEFKAPGKTPSPWQVREMERLVALGARVLVTDSFEEAKQFVLSSGSIHTLVEKLIR